jgi:hypothetical protein
MRNNGETAVIVARQHSSARHGGEARRAAHSLTPRTRCISPPPCGEGLGVGVARFFRRWRHRALTASPPSPTLPHKGGGSTPSVGRGSAPRSRRWPQIHMRHPRA